jgi:molecular chaperone DnaJ
MVTVQLETDPRFQRDGLDLHQELRVPFTQCCLGGKVAVPTLEDKDAELELKAGTQAGSTVTMSGLGVPRLDGRGRGDLHCHIQVEVPTKLNAKSRQLLLELQSSLQES